MNTNTKSMPKIILAKQKGITVDSVLDIFKKANHLASRNQTGILTGIGVTGVLTTAYLTAVASFKAANAILEDADKRAENDQDPRTTREEIELVWPFYIAPAAAAVSTISAIIMANRVASKEAAALTAAYAISDRAFQEYKDKVVEKLGQAKTDKMHDELAQDRVDKHPFNTKELILAGTGEVLCFDIFTGRYFQSTVEKIRQAENKINFEIVNCSYASLSSFYDELGLPATTMSDMLGWNLNERLEVRFSTTMSSDDRPCIAIDFVSAPMPDYGTHIY